MHADSVRLEQLSTGTEPASPISGTSRNQPNAFSAQRGIIGQISTCFRRKRKVNFSEQCTATKVLKRGTKTERCFRFSNWVGEPSSFMARVGGGRGGRFRGFWLSNDELYLIPHSKTCNFLMISTSVIGSKLPVDFQ